MAMMRNRLGFTITEMVIGLAGSAILSLVVSFFIVTLSKSSSTAQSRFAAYERIQLLRLALNDKRNCECGLAGGDPAAPDLEFDTSAIATVSLSITHPLKRYGTACAATETLIATGSSMSPLPNSPTISSVQLENLFLAGTNRIYADLVVRVSPPLHNGEVQSTPLVLEKLAFKIGPGSAPSKSAITGCGF